MVASRSPTLSSNSILFIKSVSLPTFLLCSQHHICGPATTWFCLCQSLTVLLPLP